MSQLLIHAAIAQERGAFSLEDTIEEVSRKMVRRHPHVFAGETVESPKRLLDRWDALKAEERTERAKRAEHADSGTAPPADPGDPFASLPSALPALQRAQSLVGRAERAGLEASAPPIEDETAGSSTETQLEALLWEAIAYARSHDLDAESVLRRSAARFVATARRA